MFFLAMLLLSLLLYLWLLIFHVIVLLQFIIDILGVDPAAISIDGGLILEGRVVHHLIEALIDLHLGDLLTWGHELRII